VVSPTRADDLESFIFMRLPAQGGCGREWE
jgi:hypothetical protein